VSPVQSRPTPQNPGSNAGVFIGWMKSSPILLQFINLYIFIFDR
jgi:hypothetical protein